MIKTTELCPREPAEWLGDCHPLVEQLGSTDGLLSLSSISALLRLEPVHNLASLRRFLTNYQKQILFPHELPAIESAHHHALSNETRELIALDCRLESESLLRQFAAASRRVGQFQLQKLRPLRDQRLVQRYLDAVESGRANGWHTLVYGVTLALYSLPLRQGLLGYAHQTTQSFIHSAARALHFSERTSRKLLEELSVQLPSAVEVLLRKKGSVKRESAKT